MKRVLLIPILALFSAVLHGQTSLKYSLKEGDTFTIKQSAQQLITQEIDGAAHEITNTIDGIMEFRVLGETEDNYSVAVTFKDLNLSMSSSIQGTLMDVKAGDVTSEDPQSKIFNSLLNTPVQIILAKNGDVLEVNGGDSLVAKMAKASGVEDQFTLNMMKKSLEKEFGSEALSNSYKQMTYIYPDDDKEVGESWENEYSGKLATKNVWTLDKVTETETDLSCKADVVMDLKEPATTMKLTGTQDTQVTADSESGFILKMTVEGISEGTSTLAQMGDQEIPTTIKSLITYELIDNL
ncbi:DUF6263 family protein [Poritiphilus flavus]|uniref:DUF4412 domain-containing protein n=1 Tax=Poritiphilus flavus TaxID=2697053 RepID=A0A6L9EAR9_9FLAO|nr:DUF6263 family protein [Poritiphilus flavus]NAS11682.1 hypothetical protein [Poritiphilus flavus]